MDGRGKGRGIGGGEVEGRADRGKPTYPVGENSRLKTAPKPTKEEEAFVI